MNIFRNDKLIKRNSLIAQVSMLTGLAVLGIGMYFSFKTPDNYRLSLGALLLGFLLSQVGIFFSNRWGRRPRQDELLDTALKGLDKRYSLYHYTSPVNHLLVSPSGIWVLMPYYQRGTISYENGRYKQRGGNLYLKIFAQEGLGRPEADAAAEKERLEKYLKNRFPEESFPPAEAALVFTNARAAIAIPEGAEPQYAAVLLKDLKDLIRKGGKTRSLPLEKVKLLEEAFKRE